MEGVWNAFYRALSEVVWKEVMQKREEDTLIRRLNL